MALCGALVVNVQLGMGADPVSAPGGVSKVVDVKATPEGELGVIKLSPQAEQRLGIEVGAVEQRVVPRRRTYGADLMVPPGRIARLLAPFPGIVQKHPGGAAVQPGQKVSQGEALLGLQPILTEPERLRLAEVQLSLMAGRADAEGQYKRAEAAVKLARVQAQRGSQLLEAEAGSQRGLDEARANLATADANLAAARLRRDLYANTELATPGSLPVTGLTAPLGGIVRDVPAPPGQTVNAGSALVEIADLSEMWVRVPVPLDEDGTIASNAARIRKDGDVVGETGRTRAAETVAAVVVAPPTASVTAATVDRYFVLPNEDGRWVAGMRVIATLPLVGRASNLVVPSSAVVTDVNGNSWVYARPANHTYTRRRVSVDRIDGETALLSTGPSPGTTIAVTGVAELFGVDVGFAK